MCGKAFDGTSFMASCSEDHHSGLLQIIGGGHGVSGKKPEHSHEDGHYEEKGRNYQDAPDYGGMNPAYVIKGPFMNSIYSAANNSDYSPVAEYSKKEDSPYQEAA